MPSFGSSNKRKIKKIQGYTPYKKILKEAGEFNLEKIRFDGNLISAFQLVLKKTELRSLLRHKTRRWKKMFIN